MALVIRLIESCTAVSCKSKYSLTNIGEPVGEPSRQDPLVSSIGMIGLKFSMLLGLVE